MLGGFIGPGVSQCLSSTLENCQGHEKQRTDNLLLLKETKETQQVNKKCDFGLDPGPQRIRMGNQSRLNSIINFTIILYIIYYI